MKSTNIKKLHYLTSPSGLFAIFVTHNDTSAMSYVLKDHLGSLYATVTNGDVEYYSFDAWGRDRNHNTLQYDNISTTFDRGFCMHEHYRDFGLINMNGRMYDPLVGRMLSPDIVIQNPEYSQSYNRYSYCFNNPLRFTDPSGYVVRGRYDVFNPQYFVRLNSFHSKNGNSFNTDAVEGQPMTFEDNYTVDEQGYIKLVEKTNDDFDMLYTKASWDSGKKDNSIKLDKGIIRNGKEENVSYIKKGDKDEIIRYANVHHYQIIGDNKAKLMFEYLANNTNVEWSQTLVGYSQNEKNIISTSHEYSSEIWCGFMLENGWTIRGHNHSHPRNSKPSKADIRWAESVISKFPDAMLKIYHKHNYYYYDTKETFIFY